MNVINRILINVMKYRALSVLKRVLKRTEKDVTSAKQREQLALKLLCIVWDENTDFLSGKLGARPHYVALVMIALVAGVKRHQQGIEPDASHCIYALDLMLEKLSRKDRFKQFGTWDQIVFHDANMTFESACKVYNITAKKREFMERKGEHDYSSTCSVF